MRITAYGLMVVMLMNSATLVQKQDGAVSIVPAVFLTVQTQTPQVDVHSASLGVLFMFGQTRYRLVQDITMPLHTRNAVSAVPESNILKTQFVI